MYTFPCEVRTMRFYGKDLKSKMTLSPDVIDAGERVVR